MKKTITITMIVILLLNLISINSYAEDTYGVLDDEKPISFEPQETNEATLENDEGKQLKTAISGGEYWDNNFMKLIFKAVAFAVSILPRTVNQILEFFLETTENCQLDSYTIYDTVMGRFSIFNINFMDIPANITNSSTLVERIKANVIVFYYRIRNISIAISLFVLIYIAIRMAVSTVASEKAKYKKMLVNWVGSVVLVFLMHFIIIVISFVLQIGLKWVNDLAYSWGVTQFESELYADALYRLNAKGYHIAYAFIIMHVLIWYQVKFFMYYMKRTFEVNFLVVISPIVTITYPIDKIGDGKAQAFSAFLNELILKSLMQLVHAIMYLVFIVSVGVIASNQPLLAILFFAGLSRAEKITRSIFTLKDDGIEKMKIPFVEK